MLMSTYSFYDSSNKIRPIGLAAEGGRLKARYVPGHAYGSGCVPLSCGATGRARPGEALRRGLPVGGPYPRAILAPDGPEPARAAADGAGRRAARHGPNHTDRCAKAIAAPWARFRDRRPCGPAGPADRAHGPRAAASRGRPCRVETP